jgi:hypothetical protein
MCHTVSWTLPLHNRIAFGVGCHFCCPCLVLVRVCRHRMGHEPHLAAVGKDKRTIRTIHNPQFTIHTPTASISTLTAGGCVYLCNKSRFETWSRRRVWSLGRSWRVDKNRCVGRALWSVWNGSWVLVRSVGGQTPHGLRNMFQAGRTQYNYNTVILPNLYRRSSPFARVSRYMCLPAHRTERVCVGANELKHRRFLAKQ